MSASAKGHSVHVIYDVTGKRYTVSVKASETHTSLSQITNGTLRKNMAAFVKLPLGSLELYDKSSGDILYDTDYVPVGATVNLRVVKNAEQSGKETTHSSRGTLPNQKGAASSRRLADDTVERTTARTVAAAAPPMSSTFNERPPRNPMNLAPAASTAVAAKNGGFATHRSASASSSRSRSPNMVQRPNMPNTRQPSAASVLNNDSNDKFDSDDASYPQRHHDQDQQPHHQQQRQHSNDNHLDRYEEGEEYMYDDEDHEDSYRKPYSTGRRGAEQRAVVKHQSHPSPSTSSSMARSNPTKHNTSNISYTGAEKLVAEVAMMMRNPHSSLPTANSGGAAPLAHARSNGGSTLAAATKQQQYNYRGGVEDESSVTYRGEEEEEKEEEKKEDARGGSDRVGDEDLYYRPKTSNSARRSASYRDDRDDYNRLRSRHHHQDPHDNENHKSATYEAAAGEGEERKWSARAPSSGSNSLGGAPSPSPPPQHNHKNNVNNNHNDRFSGRESYSRESNAATQNRRRRNDWGDDQQDAGRAHDGIPTHNQYNQQNGLIYQRNKTATSTANVSYSGSKKHQEDEHEHHDTHMRRENNRNDYSSVVQRADVPTWSSNASGFEAKKAVAESDAASFHYGRKKTSQSRSSQERDGLDGGNDDIDLRKKVEELTAAKDALASELETLSSRITGMQRSGSTAANNDPYSHTPYNAPSSQAAGTPRHHATYNHSQPQPLPPYAPPTPPYNSNNMYTNYNFNHHPQIAPPLSSSVLPSAVGTPSRERFSAPMVSAVPPIVAGGLVHGSSTALSASMTPYGSVTNPITDYLYHHHQQQQPRDGSLGTSNVSTYAYNGNNAVAGVGHRDYQRQQRRAEEVSRLRQQIDTLKAVMEEDAQKHAAGAKSLQHTIRSKQEARVGALQRLVADQKRLRNIAKEELSAAEENFNAAKRYADSSEAEAEDHRRQVDSSTAQLDTIKARIAHILLHEGHQKRSSSSSTSSAEDLAQAIVAAAAQRSKAALLLEQCKRDNGGLRQGFDDLALRRKLLHNELEDAKGNIRVVVRLRPRLPSDDLTPHTLGSIEEGSLEISEARKCAYVTTPTAGSRCYEFYDVYGPAKDSLAQQGDVFEAQVLPLLNSVFDGYNVAVLAYGQTGSGKTFTIIGETADGTLSGLLPQSIEFMLSDAASKRTHYPTTITMTMVELYMDTVYDLLHVYDPANADIGERPDSARGGMDRNRRCELRQLPGTEGVTVVGAVEVILDSWAQAMQIIHTGINERQTHKTLKNAFSSRSHMILTVNVEVERTPGHLQRSKLVFSDLAGSERVSRSLSQGDRLKEAQHINKSLSALGDVLHALSATPRPQHIPYRNSKLTQLLQSTIGGNSKTLMVACVSPHLPAHHNLVETQSTLQFASRARLIRNTFTNKR